MAMKRVVGDDDVDVLGGLARPLDEALRDHRALAAQALVRRDRHLPPGALADAGDQLVAVAGLGRRRPTRAAAPPRRRAATAGRRSTWPTDEQRVLVVGEAALELVRAQVVAPALDQRVGRPAAEQRRERLGQPRHVAVDDLGLQGQRGGGDDGRLAGVHGVGAPRARGRPATCRCRCRPARAGGPCRRSRRRRRGPSRPARAARCRRPRRPRRGGARRG